MKTQKIVKFLFFFILISCLISCEKDEFDETIKTISEGQESYNNINLEDSFSKSMIDSIAIECAEFHGVVLKKILESDIIYNTSDVSKAILDTINNNIENSNFKYSSTYLKNYRMTLDEYYNITCYNENHNCFFSENINNSFYNSFDLEQVNSYITTMFPLLESLVQSSTSMEELIVNYRNQISIMIKSIEDINTYFCVCIAANVCINSFEIWAAFFCNVTNDKESFWDKVKKTTKKIKMYAEVDLEGAAVGAIAGAVDGAVVGGITGGAAGALTLGTAGAVAGSFSGAVASSAQFYMDRH